MTSANGEFRFPGTLILAVFMLAISQAAIAQAWEQDEKPDPKQDTEKSQEIKEDQRITSPGQLQIGPGGSSYPHEIALRETFGVGGEEYWLFLPARPTPKKAPVIVFLHGWGALWPMPYEAWVTHLARRGNIVIYPRYQKNLFTKPKEFTPNAIKAVKAALEELKSAEGMKPDLTRVAIVGHSAGGTVAANMAAMAQDEGLPVPKALMVIEPGRIIKPMADFLMTKTFPLEDFSKIAEGTLMLVIVGEDDDVVGETLAKKIFHQARSVEPKNKNFVVVQSDKHGDTELKADHLSPCGQLKKSQEEGGTQLFQPRRRLWEEVKDKVFHEYLDVRALQVDALDYYGYWKLFDALTDAAFYEKNRQYALGDTSKQRFMGRWSDGTPVKELKVTTAQDSKSKKQEEKEEEIEPNPK